MPAVGRADLRRVIEALLFIGSHPVTWERIERCLPGTTRSQFDVVLWELAHSYDFQRRPYELFRTPKGAVLRLREEFAGELATKSKTEKGAKLARPVIETLSVVAYMQPVSRAAIEKAIGADAGSALRQLIRRQLVQARDDESSQQPVYVTTVRFLEMFGLESLDELPQIEELTS